jgi:hypothetical protein
MLGIFSVGERLAASQGGLSSVELVTFLSASIPVLFISDGTGVAGVKVESRLIFRRNGPWHNPANSGQVEHLNALRLIEN